MFVLTCLVSEMVKLCTLQCDIYTGKVKFTLEQAMQAQRGNRGIALLFP
jgi:hypothetical protein